MNNATRSVSVFGTLGEAWRLTKGVKGTIWITLFFIALLGTVFFGIPVLIARLATKMSVDPSYGPMLRIVIAGIYAVGVGVVFPGAVAAFSKIAIERARLNPVSFKLGFRAFFRRFFPVLLTLILVYAILGIPVYFIYSVDVSTPTIATLSTELVRDAATLLYIIIALPFLSQSMMFAVDQTVNPFAAVYGSFKAVRGHFFAVLLIIVLVQLMLTVLRSISIAGKLLDNQTIMTAGKVFYLFTLIWIIPFQALVYGTLYHKLVD